MFKRQLVTLPSNLTTGGTLKLGPQDKVAIRDSGHRLFANGVRYDANTDFTIAVDAATGETTLTWLHTTTLTAGLIILVGIAFIDSITSSDGSGGGGGDATAANQTLQLTELTNIKNILNTEPINPDARTRTPVNISGADVDTVIALVAGKRHVITGAILKFSGAAVITINNHPNDFVKSVVAGEDWILDDNLTGWWTTDVGEAFTIGKDANITVTGMLYSKAVD